MDEEKKRRAHIIVGQSRKRIEKLVEDVSNEIILLTVDFARSYESEFGEKFNRRELQGAFDDFFLTFLQSALSTRTKIHSTLLKIVMKEIEDNEKK
jgi:hypothetical protein